MYRNDYKLEIRLIFVAIDWCWTFWALHKPHTTRFIQLPRIKREILCLILFFEEWLYRCFRSINATSEGCFQNRTRSPKFCSMFLSSGLGIRANLFSTLMETEFQSQFECILFFTYSVPAETQYKFKKEMNNEKYHQVAVLSDWENRIRKSWLAWNKRFNTLSSAQMFGLEVFLSQRLYLL